MEDVSPAFDSKQAPTLCTWTEWCRGSSGYAQALGGLRASALTLLEPRDIMEKGPATGRQPRQGFPAVPSYSTLSTGGSDTWVKPSSVASPRGVSTRLQWHEWLQGRPEECPAESGSDCTVLSKSRFCLKPVDSGVASEAEMENWNSVWCSE